MSAELCGNELIMWSAGGWLGWKQIGWKQTEANGQMEAIVMDESKYCHIL